MATREFLNLLSNHKDVQSTPLYYISDHDLYGMDIFTVLKFGSKATAWASPTLVCPRIHWAGPTYEALKAAVSEHALAKKAMMLKGTEAVSEGAAEGQAERWATKMLSTLRSKMGKKRMSKEAKARYKSLWQSGTLRLQSEEDFADELRAMKNQNQVSSSLYVPLRPAHNGQQFSLLYFSLVQPHGAELYAIKRLQELAPQASATRIQAPEPQISQRTKAFDNADRNSSTEPSAEDLQAARSLTMDMFEFDG